MQSNLAATCRQARRAGRCAPRLSPLLLAASLVLLVATSADSAERFAPGAPADSLAAGQVPLGRTDPGSSPGWTRGGRTAAKSATGRALRYQSPAAAGGGVIPAQYAAPPGGYYGQPGAAAPAAAPPGYGNPGYGAPGYQSPGFGYQGPANPNYGSPGNGNPGYPGYGNPGAGPGAPGGGAFGPPPGAPPIDQAPPGVVPQPGGPVGENGLLPPDSPLLKEPQPMPTVPVDIIVKERQTGTFQFGVAVNSNAGLMGNIVIDEQNFDLWNPPRSWEEIRNATAFRGRGQQMRIEAMPGNLLSRYGIVFREPYLFDTRINFGIDGHYFNRFYQNWTEQRTGGRISFGYQLTPDLSAVAALGGENVHIGNPTLPAPPELLAVLGDTHLFIGSVQLIHDVRDSPFMATQGHRISIELDQGFGSFSFPRAIINTQKYFLLHQRADGSGRHVLSFINDTGFTGQNTPIYENFFAGGYNTIRGFYYRGASPLDMGVQVGGKFEFLNSVQYMLPITADDSLRAVAFVDMGTVEPSTELKWQDFRIAPGLGLRINIPAMGPAPIALDFAVPVHKAPGDHIQVFNFFMGFNR